MIRDFAGRLHANIAAVCPIVSVSIGSLADKATWTFDAPAATAPQRAAAQSVIDNFDATDAAQSAWEEDQQPDRKAIKQAATQAIADNAQIVSDNATYLAIGSPSNAQVAAQVRRLTQEATRLAQENTAIIKRLIKL